MKVMNWQRWYVWTTESLGGRPVLFSALVLLWLLASAERVIGQSNPIVVENAQPGNPSSQWDISGAGDTSIQGFATQISVNKGETVHFKIDTSAGAYRLDIYRMGYYQGNGARLIASVLPSVSLPQNQPGPATDSATGLMDYGTWAESASWTVPATAVSGIYFAKVIRTDTGGASHIVFIVRDDSSTSDILFQTSDATWQAYNDYGGNSLYLGSPVSRAYKVSYNRPFNTRGDSSHDWVFHAEYPMVRWLEANGYNVTYTSEVDADARGSLLLAHKLFMAVGHDEYWSGGQRANVEAARAAGVNLAFLSGNEVSWKTRWEPSIDGSSTPYRTLVCYKESLADAKIDPSPTWTGYWRDPRFSPPADGGRPENRLTGTLSVVNDNGQSYTIQVPAQFVPCRFWRNTTIASLPAGGTGNLGAETLGYEWDISPDNGFRPPGLMLLSSTTVSGVPVLQGYGLDYVTGTATHNLTLYRDPSGALVFGAGTVQWSWGLDSQHDDGSSVTSPAMQQATVNLLADMGLQPGSMQSGLVPATQSTDHTAPVSSIRSPAAGAAVTFATQVVIAGTASDIGGQVAGIEVSTDGGTTWHPASGLSTWSYNWTALQAGPATILSRAVDDSGNLETPAAGVGVTVLSTPGTIWPASAAPTVADAGPDGAVELGVKFRSDVAGQIAGIRFYKSSLNTGTHAGDLWTSNGTLLASATFTGETASGWQQVNFSTPVPITANTVYVASYHSVSGHYSEDDNYFLATSVDNPPLHALADGVSRGNGVYGYGTSSVFPNQTFSAANYWVDVAFQSGVSAALSTITVTPANPTLVTGTSQQFTATGTYSDGSTQDLTSQAVWTSSAPSVATINPAGLASTASAGLTVIAATVTGVAGNTVLTVASVPLGITTGTLAAGVVSVAYSAVLSASGGTTPYSWSVASGSLPPGLSLNATNGAVTGTPTSAGAYTFTVRVYDSSNPVQTAARQFSLTIASLPAVTSLWPSTTVPGTADSGPDSAVELGVKFRSDVAGKITGIRFYKATANTGAHVGNLWSSAGTLLGSITFSNETASGWQQMLLASPVAITSNTVYVASYHCPVGHYSEDDNYFASKGVDSPPLHALTNGVSGGNGVYAYGTSSVFPIQTWSSANYWVDVVFQAAAAPSLSSIAVTPANATNVVGATQQYTATGTYADGSTQNVTSQAAWSSSKTAVATISGSGLATGVSAGSTTISATLAGVTGSTILTVQAAPLAITTASLATGTVSVAYSATLAASGGTLPYTWSVASGALPAGLTLNAASGAITGTPTTAGSFSFTAKVTDAGSPVQTATKALSLTIATVPTAVSIWASTAVPGVVDSGPDSAVELGVKFRSDVNGKVTGIRFYKAAANTGTHVGNLWSSAGTKLGSATFSGESASGWQQVSFTTPVAITSNTVYVASYHCTIGHYSEDDNYFASKGVDNPPLHALANGVSGGDGVYRYGTSSAFPNQTYNSANYWVDVVFTTP
jgi:hypothetical protein